MPTSWSGPAGVLVEHADAGWAGIWSLAFAAGTAAVHLATLPGADEDLAFTYAGFDLNTALGEIETVVPEVLTTAPAVDLGTVHVTDARVGALVIAGLLDAAITRVAALTGTPGVPMAELVVLARVQPLLITAREKVAGVAW